MNDVLTFEKRVLPRRTENFQRYTKRLRNQSEILKSRLVSINAHVLWENITDVISLRFVIPRFTFDNKNSPLT